MDRRTFLTNSAVVVAGAAAAPWMLPEELSAQRSIGAAFAYFPDNAEWSWMFLRAAGGGDLNELHRACAQMKSGDNDSWFGELKKLADDTRDEASRAEKAGRRSTARDAYRRASNYYFYAQFYHFDGRKKAVYRDCVDTFNRFIDLAGAGIERVSIPYEKTSMPGYIVHARGSRPGARPPACIYIGGVDSTKESSYGGVILPADRGMTTIMFDGPGQGELLNFQGIPSRYDYEVPVRAAVDFLQKRADVDPARIGLVGSSLGGYYAPRAAAFEPRIAALLCISAAYGLETRKAVNEQFRYVLGAKTDAEAIEKMKQFGLKGIASRIKCPVLVSHGADDNVENAHGLFAELTTPKKELKIWTRETGGSTHNMADNRAVAWPWMFDWLAEQLQGKAVSSAQE